MNCKEPSTRDFRSKSDRLENSPAPWKVLLPFSEGPILAVGLRAGELASFARCWKIIHTFKCHQHEVDWAGEQAQDLGYECKFESFNFLNHKAIYTAIGVHSAFLRACDPEVAFSLLKPGGAVAWFPGYRGLPSTVDLGRKSFESAKSYAFLPPNSGNILVPIGDSRMTMAGLNLYVPGKWLNRLALRIAKTVSAAGFPKTLGIKRVVVARKSGSLADGQYLVNWLSRKIGQPVEDVSIYNGWTKTVLQLLDRQGHVIGFAKIANTELGRQGILRETDALRHLETAPTLKNLVPRILSSGDWQRCTFQVQTAPALGPRKFTAKLTRAHLDFLTRLSQTDQREMLLEQWPCWPVIWNWAHDGQFSSPKESEIVRTTVGECADILRNAKIPFHRIHGDFSPWNALMGADGLGVVDWEESEENGLPLFDAINFAVKVAVLLRHTRLSLGQLLLGSSSILAIEDELSFLVSSISLNEARRFSPEQFRALVSLCLIIAAGREYHHDPPRWQRNQPSQ